MKHVPGSHPSGTLRPVPFERPQARRASNLPRPLTSFIGRKDDIAMVMSLLAHDDVRLLTLGGPGGVGKTRLAIQVAGEMTGQYPDGVIWVPLVQTHDPALVGSAISRVVQVSRPDLIGRDPVSLLRQVHGLLVLDNFEHVIGAAPLIATFLAECPALKILVTSRQTLDLTGEHVYTVPSFTWSGDNDAALSDAPLAPEAVQLFVERARARDTTFSLTKDNAEAVTAICATLDGLPLAIELAAAQIPMFTPASLLPRLEKRLSMLMRGPIDTDDRHRTMRGAIGWSYDLLDPPLQAAFRRLAVFVGGFSLEAADAVIDHPAGTLEVLSSLLSRCLIASRPAADVATRFGMLETIREFGLERLAESGDEDTARDRHAAWMQTVADRCEMSWFKPLEEGERLMAELDRERPNALAALRWLDRKGDPEATLRLAGHLGGMWFIHGFINEGCRWLDAARDPETPLSPATRAKALVTRSWIAVSEAKPDLVIRTANESLQLSEPLDRPDITVSALVFRSMAASELGDHDRARNDLYQSARILDVMPPSPAVYNQRTMNAILLGKIAMARGDIEEANAMFQEAVERQLGAGQEVGHGYVYASHILSCLGDMARIRGDERAAIKLYREHLLLAWRFQWSRIICSALAGIGAALAGLGDTASAARLLGASERAHERYNVPFQLHALARQRALGLPEPWARETEPCPPEDALREALRSRRPRHIPPITNVVEADALWEAGRQLSLADAIEEALTVEIETAVSGPDHGLTARELEVLRLIAHGKTDRQIAEALYISHRTAEWHVRNVLGKLGATNRAEAVALATRDHLL